LNMTEKIASERRREAIRPHPLHRLDVRRLRRRDSRCSALVRSAGVHHHAPAGKDRGQRRGSGGAAPPHRQRRASAASAALLAALDFAPAQRLHAQALLAPQLLLSCGIGASLRRALVGEALRELVNAAPDVFEQAAHRVLLMNSI
jgi:hypothetical protein